MRKAIIITGTLLSISVLLLTACGQMGPLYAPEEPKPPEAQSSPDDTPIS